MSDPNADTVIGVFFSLIIDTWDLGVFISCQGLGIDFQVTPFEEGGGGTTVFPLPGRIKYTNLQVTRPVGPDTKRTMAWLQSMVNNVTPTTAQLAALDTNLKPIVSWALSGVIPVKWTGPTFNAGNLQEATESLELAYGSIMLGQS
jgi:phage tail-like protein